MVVAEMTYTKTVMPKEILENWRFVDDNIRLVLQDTTSESGNSMIIVHAKHVPSNRTSRLFTIKCHPSYPYPISIYMEIDRTVCTTFNECRFRENLAKMFNLPIIKDKILDLATFETECDE